MKRKRNLVSHQMPKHGFSACHLILGLSLCLTLALLAALSASAWQASFGSGAKNASASVESTKEPGATSILAAIHAKTSPLPEVDRLDRSAYGLQAKLADKVGDASLSDADIEDAVLAWVEAELALDGARDAAWSALPNHWIGAALIDTPMHLALLDLQIELRRLVGPVFHTRVPDLISDRGCAGDLVAERLIYLYGSAAASAVRVANARGEDSAAEHLGRFAVQVACLSTKQLYSLEYALSDGFDAVAERMSLAGLEDLIPAFARLVAPLQVLLLDATKHWGEHSSAWQWFSTYGLILSEDVLHAGWTTEELLVWDRRYGVLVGFPHCAPGARGADCVDLERFLYSLSDPRALGMGNCALGAMLSRGLDPLGSEQLYTCPTRACGSTLSPGCLQSFGGITAAGIHCQEELQNFQVGFPGTSPYFNAEQRALQDKWPQLDQQDLAQMQSLCYHAKTDLQGVNFSLEDCFDFDLSANNPFDQHMACVSEALGLNEEPGIGGEFAGVPQGSECRRSLTSGGEEEGGTPTPSTGSGSGGSGSSDGSGRGGSSGGSGSTAGSGSSGGSGSSAGSGSGGSGSGGIETLDIKVTHTSSITDENATDALIQHFLKKHQEAIAEPRSMTVPKPEPPAPRGPWEAPFPPPMMCADLDCSDNCTGLGQQLDALKDCNDEFLNSLAEAYLGGGKKDVKPRLDIVSKPRPDETPPGGDANLAPCLGENLHPRTPTQCGLVLCPDGFLANRVGEECTCGENIRFEIVQICTTARCADGTLPDANCLCNPNEGYQPPLPPEPDPLSTRQSLNSKGSATPPTLRNAFEMNPVHRDEYMPGNGLIGLKGF